MTLALADIVPLNSFVMSGFRREPVPPAVAEGAPDSASFYRSADNLSVIISLEERGKDGLWLHCSASVDGGKRVPMWKQLLEVKNLVHGNRLAIQILPPRSDYSSVAEVLHLWERLDAPTIPESAWRIR